MIPPAPPQVYLDPPWIQLAEGGEGPMDLPEDTVCIRCHQSLTGAYKWRILYHAMLDAELVFIHPACLEAPDNAN